MSRQTLPCQDFLSFLLLILKGRALNPDDPAPEFGNFQIRFVIDEYYKTQANYAGNRFLPVVYKKPEHFPVPMMQYVVYQWRHGEYRLEYFLTVLKYIGPLLFDSDLMVYGLELAEKELELEKGTLVKDWEYLLSLKSDSEQNQ